VLALDRTTQLPEIKTLMSQPDFALGSVHAITRDGMLVIASALGSQLASYAWGAGKVIFVVGAQKLVRDLDAAHERIHQHSLKLEDARALEAYGKSSRGAVDIREGHFAGDSIAIEFPDRGRAEAWYESEAYQEIVRLRTKNSERWVVLLDGVTAGHRATDILAAWLLMIERPAPSRPRRRRSTSVSRRTRRSRSR
jgi:uncharacterized protein (DUF1330 family)